MTEIGTYLKERRQELHFTMKDIYKKSGITDSKLSRIEHGEGRPLTPAELRKFAELYHENIVTLYLMAGYLSDAELKEYRLFFENAALLTPDERKCIQMQINLLTKGRMVINNDL